MANGFTFTIHGPESIRRIIAALWKLPKGWIVTISQAKRTNAQNDKMWAMLTDVSVAKPQGRSKPPHKWKAVFMDACGHKPEYDENLDGDGFICLGYKSSRLTKAEMGEVIDCIEAYGNQNGVKWSNEEKRNAA